MKVLAVSFAVVFSAGAALAQILAVSERFCLAPQGDASPAPQRCTFATLADYEAAKQRQAEECVPNRYLTFPQPEDKLRLPRELRQ